MKDTAKIYRNRFPKREYMSRQTVWTVLTKHFFQNYISQDDTVLDIGAGYCEFLKVVRCKHKVAVDINSDTKKFAPIGTEVINSDAAKLPHRFNNRVDVVFISNLLEHLESKEKILKVLEQCHKVLKQGGKILILQPNIDLVKEKYWSFFDHKMPLNGDSVLEALELSGFEVRRFIRNFLPYTTKIKTPKSYFLVWLYLKIPTFLRPFVGQSFFVGVKK